MGKYGNGKALKRFKRTKKRRLTATWRHDDGMALKTEKGKALKVDEWALKGIGPLNIEDDLESWK